MREQVPIQKKGRIMDDRFKMGNPCKYGHGKEEGKTPRNIANGACVICSRERSKRYRIANPEYLKDYYKMLQTERPETLHKYFVTQIERGNRKRPKNPYKHKTLANIILDTEKKEDQ